MSSVTVIHEKCDLEKDNNIKLPYTAYVVQYEHEGNLVHDIAMAQKAVDIFDHYYDKYKKEFKWLKQSKGSLRPNLLNSSSKAPHTKRKKRSSSDGELK